MKKLIFFLLIGFTFYWAGMYHSLSLMVLCAAEFLLLVVLCILPRLFRNRLTVCFPEQRATTIAGVDTVCRVSLHNRGRLPVNRVGLRLRVWYLQDSKGVEKKIYGGAVHGDSLLEFQISPAYCGLIQIRIDRLRAFDYLSLFSSSKRIKEEMRLAVFPGEQAIRINIASFGWDQSGMEEERTISRPGDSFQEIRQIREYRFGDSNRHIHWNQSAKTDQVWIKEYEKDMDLRTDVLLDLSGLSCASSEKSAFYRLLSALVLGLLRETAAVRVHWSLGGELEMASVNVSNENECRNMLLLLYQTEFAQNGDAKQDAPEQTSFSKTYAFRLTADLSLFAGGQLVHRFSAETLEQELREKEFVI